MLARAARLAAALAAALAATAAAAQWRTEPLVVWLDGAGLDVVTGTLTAAAGRDDLLVLDQARRTAGERRHAALLSPVASPFPVAGLGLERAFRAGYLAQNGADALADVASHFATGGLGTPPSRIDVVPGNEPATVRSFDLPVRTDSGGPAQGGPPYVVSFLRLLARAQHPDTLVLPYCLSDICANLFLLDLDPAAVPTAGPVRTVPAPNLVEPTSEQPEAFPVWLSTTAQAGGVDDVAAGAFGTVVLWAQQGTRQTLATLDLADPVVVGTTRHTNFSLPPWLPPTITRFSDVQGVASLDVDQDGIPDLVFTMANPAFPALRGSLVWVKGTGALSDFAEPLAATWHDLGAQLGLVDPVTVRPLRGSPASIAVWDRAGQELVVVTPVPAEGRLAVWRAPARGGFAKDLRLADVVGSPEGDLLVVMESPGQPDAVLVFPDLVLPGPILRWAPGSPGTWLRGAPFVVAVELDPAGSTTVLVEWVTGAPTSAPVGTGLSLAFPASCPTVLSTVAVTARGTDDTGLFSELGALLRMTTLPLGLSLSGAPRGPVVLPPGGTTVVLDATAATGCGEVAFGGTPWPAGATVSDSSGATSLRRTVALPEAAYPALLADPAFTVSLATSDPTAVSSPVSFTVPFDGSGLVEVTHTSDRSALAEGEVAVVRTRVRSRLGVALPLVRVVDVLAGLQPAGAPTVTGAAIVASARGGAELLLDALPPAGGEVVVELPVRAVTPRGASGVEARSSGGWPLTAPARVEALGAPAPGCGCGAGSAPGTLAFVLVALALRRGGRRAT